MRIKLLLVTLAVSLIGPALLAGDDEVGVLYVPREIPYSKTVEIRGKTRDQCDLGAQVARFLASSAKGTYSKVVRDKPKSGAYHVLEAEIIKAWGAGGGAWSGPKHLKIKGKLTDHKGKALGDFTAGRVSVTGGVFGGLKGTCKIFHRCAKAIGKDIGIWLADPQPASMVGDQ